jgi:NADH-quinone oxidoreductase subunit G
MCLVEIEKMPKLQIACATTVTDGMVIHTQTEKVKKARQDVLEFLLLNHPLDCPICDQVGECYLQDYYMEYGLKKSRIDLKDKNRKPKRRDIGKHLILDNERCILCTRCVRFCEEVTKTSELFINSRGDHSFIDIKTEEKLDNDYSLNIADICPVGAFTSKDFRFKERVYRLSSTSSICLSCATGCKIKVQHNNGKIYRILPDPNIYTNTWICDNGRMSYKITAGSDRLTKSIIKSEEYHLNKAIIKLFDILKEAKEKNLKIAILLSDYLSIEDNFALYYLGFEILKTDLIYASKEKEQKIEDGILINKDKTPNSNAVSQISKLYGIKKYEDLKDCDLLIGFYDDIEKLNIPKNKSVALSYKADKEYDNLIAIKTYFETEGSFINWQYFLRKTAPSVSAPTDTISVYDLCLKISELFGYYPKEKELNKIFNELKYKTED